MKRFISVFCALVLTFAFALPARAADGKTVKLCTYSSLGSLSPYEIKNDVQYEAVRYVFDCLYYLDENDRAREMMGKDLQISEDKREYRVTLRDDLTWHDGSKVTIDDVIFTFENAKNVPWFRDCVSNLESISAEGNEITFKLKRTDPVFMEEAICYVPIVPKAFYEKGEHAAMGCGAFKAKTIDENGKYVFEATDYYLTETNVSTVEIDTLNSKEECAKAVIDAKYATVFGELDGESFKRFNEYEHGTVEIYGFNTDALFFNANTPLFASADLRKAVSLGIDYERIIGECYGGYADVGSTGFISSRLEYGDRELKARTDIDAAKELLIRNGFSFDGETLRDKNGNAVKVTLAVEPGREQLGEIIKDGFNAIGIECEVKAVSEEAFDSALKGSEFDCGVMQLKNYYQYCESGIGALIEKYSASETLMQSFNTYMDETDPNKRYDRLFELQRAVSEETPFVALCYPKKLSGYEKSQYDTFAYKEGVGVYSVLSFISNKKSVAAKNNAGILSGADHAEIGFLKAGLVVIGFIAVGFAVLFVHDRMKKSKNRN